MSRYIFFVKCEHLTASSRKCEKLKNKQTNKTKAAGMLTGDYDNNHIDITLAAQVTIASYVLKDYISPGVLSRDICNMLS